mgnify:CR=1 FL=1
MCGKVRHVSGVRTVFLCFGCAWRSRKTAAKVHTEEQQKAVVLSPIHLEAARFSNFNCLAGNFGECAAGFKIENYFTGAELLPSAGGCTVLFIACERTADR